MTTSTIITTNTGSSSIKIAIFSVNQGTINATPLLTMSITNIGQSISLLQIAQSDMPTHTEDVSAPNHRDASDTLIDRLTSIISPNDIIAIGHRLVHGGSTYTGPTLVENIAAPDWEILSRLDPHHTPAAHQLITQFTQRYPSIPQIACFDTAFFNDLPHIATIIPIPQKYYAKGVRRYGFHGLSYTSLLATFSEKAGLSATNGRIIMAHLGSGASLAAIHQGKPIDTTMGFTPTSGIIMSTRSGDLDPNIFSFLNQHIGMSIDEFDHMVSFESGLLGVSQSTGDMQALLSQENSDDAATAIELFVRDVKKSIGALTALLGGVDSVIFSGGIGERSAVLRSRICQGFEYMGIEIDDDANAQNSFLISSQNSRVGVHVIPTDEARVIANQTYELLTEKDIV